MHRSILLFIIAMLSKKRKHFNIEEKARIISKLENGATNKNLATEYEVSHSTISTIWKERDKIKSFFDSSSPKMKRARTAKHTEIEKAMLTWFKYQSTNNMSLSGPFLQQKANEFARRLGDQDFVCSSSWIHRFRVRHNIIGGKSGEATTVSDGVVEEWLTRKWPILSEGYGPDAIFSADETGLFYNLTPDKTLQFKGEQCTDGKMSMMRLTIMVAANMTGSTKKKLLVIGKSKKPRCFKNIHSLPVTYKNNTKSWMTSEIFQKWLRNWDSELKENKKKILLLVDNCLAHPVVTNLQCIKLVFFPPNATSVLHPMDQGVIRCLKTHYRTLQVSKIIQNLDSNNKEHKSFSVLDAILMISEAWEKVTQKTIANCFRLAGFKDLSTTLIKDEDPLSLLQSKIKKESPVDISADEEDDISLTQLARILKPDISPTEVDDFIDIDSSISVCAPATDDDIVAEIQEQTDEQDEDDEQFTVPSLNEGLYAISVLQKIIMCNDQFQRSNFEETLVIMQRELQNTYLRQKCHKQSTEYLK